MASLARTRIHYLTRRNFSTLLSPDSKTPLSAKDKTRAAISLIKSEQNPQKIIDAARAAALTPDIHIDRVALSLTVNKLSKFNNFSYIHTLLDDLKKTRPDLRNDRFFSQSIVLYGQANMLDHAERTFKEFLREIGAVRGAGNDSPKDFSGDIAAVSGSGDDSTEDFSGHIASGSGGSGGVPAVSFDVGDGGAVKVFNALLFACVLAKDYKKLNTIFVEFPKIYNVELNLESYNTVIKGFSESGNSGSVYSILAEMDRQNVRPNRTTFGYLISGLYSEEKFDEVEKVLQMMSEKYGITPGISIYNVRIQSLCKLRKSREALLLFDGFVTKGVRPNSVTLIHLIHGFCREGDLEEAKRLFSNMGSYACQPDANCYYTLVYYLCQGGDFETSLRICKESIEKKWVPNVSIMKSLVKGLGGRGKVDEAKELIAKIKEKFSRNVDQWDEVEASLTQ